MLNNKLRDMTPFDMKKPPMKQKWYLMPLIWGGSWIMTRQFRLKINKKNMSEIKPPYLVISTHQGFSDYYIAPLALFPHRANYVSDMEGFAAFGEWLYRAIGCIGKRRYVSDSMVVKNIKYSLDKGCAVVRLQYDEYKWQQDNNISITEPKRAEGLHKALYQCRKCQTEFSMESASDKLYCIKCHAEWQLAPLGYLEFQSDYSNEKSDIIHIPDWYEWQRTNVIEEINADKYSVKFNVRVEALPNSKGFVPLGNGTLIHSEKGFYLRLDGRELFFDHYSRESVQTEYNYRGRLMLYDTDLLDVPYYNMFIHSLA